MGETLRLLLLVCGVVDEAGDHELLVGHRGFELVVVDLPVPVHVDLPEALVHLAAARQQGQVSSPHPESKAKKGEWAGQARTMSRISFVLMVSPLDASEALKML